MFFATVGFCGIWDAAEIIWPDASVEQRVEFMRIVVERMVEKTKGVSNGMKFNVEEVPSESAAGKMAKFNRDFGERKKYYSNQFIPLAVDIPLHKRIDYEAKLQSALTGGGMTFLNFDSHITPEQSYEIHKHMLESGFHGQFCINYGYSHCPACGTTAVGQRKNCDVCGSNTEFYTRVVGYLAKISDTAQSKADEIEDRVNYLEVKVPKKLHAI